MKHSCGADDEVVVARRTGGHAEKSQYEQHFVEAVTGPPAGVEETIAVEQQPLAVRAAQENHFPRARPIHRQPSAGSHEGVQQFDDDFVDAGAVDAGDDSDASEMSKEVKGDHDVNIEDFDRPLMNHSVEVAARKAGVPTRRGTCSDFRVVLQTLQRPDFTEVTTLRSNILCSLLFAIVVCSACLHEGPTRIHLLCLLHHAVSACIGSHSCDVGVIPAYRPK